MSTDLAGFFAATRQLVECDDLVTQRRTSEFARSHDGLMFVKRDDLFPSLRRGRRPDARWWNAPRSDRRLLVVGESDIFTSTRDIALLRIAGVQRVVGCNTSPTARSESIPIGLSDPGLGGHHDILGDTDHLRIAFDRTDRNIDHESTTRSNRPIVYVNVSVTTAPSHRSALVAAARTSTTCTIDEPVHTAAGRIGYLERCRQHAFVACPRGNGFDTHRVWETLYMGSVPILLDSPLARRVYAGLPVVFVDDWSALGNRDLLVKKFERLARERWFTPQLLSQIWWHRRLHDLARTDAGPP